MEEIGENDFDSCPASHSRCSNKAREYVILVEATDKIKSRVNKNPFTVL